MAALGSSGTAVAALHLKSDFTPTKVCFHRIQNISTLPFIKSSPKCFYTAIYQIFSKYALKSTFVYTSIAISYSGDNIFSTHLDSQSPQH